VTSISKTLRAALVGVVLVMALVATSCGSSEADGEVEVAPPREAVELIDSGDYVVLDVRTVEAFEAGHVAGAVSLPYRTPGFDTRLRELDRDERYLVYSRSGEAASEVTERMVAEGFEGVVDAGSFGLLAIAGAPLD
jgi:rhodanese-related sulfurtransferase